jgi:hypothetical protein
MIFLTLAPRRYRVGVTAQATTKMIHNGSNTASRHAEGFELMHASPFTLTSLPSSSDARKRRSILAARIDRPRLPKTLLRVHARQTPARDAGR